MIVVNVNSAIFQLYHSENKLIVFFVCDYYIINNTFISALTLYILKTVYDQFSKIILNGRNN